MKTTINPSLTSSLPAIQAIGIIEKCVHCGFCNATCPTYLELGDERDGPRGRIYLIKQLLERGSATERTRTHLDRCLSCRSCETTCPSGVEYGRLLDIGRNIIENQQVRPLNEKFLRWALCKILPYRKRFTFFLRLGQAFRWLLPAVLSQKIPERTKTRPWPENTHSRIMIVLAGCAQPGATPNTNVAAARVFDKLGISLQEIDMAGCCGAMSYHMSRHDEALNFARHNIDAWWPAVENGAEALVITASGCGTMVKDYGELLRSDSVYAAKASKISSLTKDLSEILLDEDLSKLHIGRQRKKTAIHCPCSLAHAQNLPMSVENILSFLKVDVAKTRDQHLCCGSAGVYSILEPKMSRRLLDKKLIALTMDNPQRIVTANVGCQLHLASRADVPVMHWIELVDELVTG